MLFIAAVLGVCTVEVFMIDINMIDLRFDYLVCTMCGFDKLVDCCHLIGLLYWYLFILLCYVGGVCFEMGCYLLIVGGLVILTCCLRLVFCVILP